VRERNAAVVFGLDECTEAVDVNDFCLSLGMSRGVYNVIVIMEGLGYRVRAAKWRAKGGSFLLIPAELNVDLVAYTICRASGILECGVDLFLDFS
jgi:hypothetical protein